MGRRNKSYRLTRQLAPITAQLELDAMNELGDKLRLAARIYRDKPSRAHKRQMDDALKAYDALNWQQNEIRNHARGGVNSIGDHRAYAKMLRSRHRITTPLRRYRIDRLKHLIKWDGGHATLFYAREGYRWLYRAGKPAYMPMPGASGKAIIFAENRADRRAQAAIERQRRSRRDRALARERFERSRADLESRARQLAADTRMRRARQQALRAEQAEIARSYTEVRNHGSSAR